AQPQQYQQPSQSYGTPAPGFEAAQYRQSPPQPGPGGSDNQMSYQSGPQQVPQYQQARPGTYAGEPVTPAVPTPAVSDDVAKELAHLNQMHELGVITDAELEQKRRQILRGD
ncbi:MAG TPA: SHOCT domain-containing protein, partial [Acidimicrobiales bacterium]|nr:SHOCT domain-containing protein [Acidimicrobiales bacterium]